MKEITENRELVFYREIHKNPVTISLKSGWIWIEENIDDPKFLRPFNKTKTTTTFTSEEAKTLCKAIEDLLK